MQELLELMRTRRSIRRYTDAPISEGQLKAVLQAGLLAPSGHNFRPVHLIAVRDRETLNALSDCRVGSAKMLSGAGAAVAVLGDSTLSDTITEDCSIAMAQMLLAAHAEGLGACWIQARQRVAPDGRTTDEYVRSVLGYPETLKLEAVLSLGVPGETKAAHELPDTCCDAVSYERWNP